MKVPLLIYCFDFKNTREERYHNSIAST